MKDWWGESAQTLSLSLPDEKGPRNSRHQQRSMTRHYVNRAVLVVFRAQPAWKNRTLVIQWKVRSFSFSLDRVTISMKSFFSACGKQRITIIRPLLIQNSLKTSLMCLLQRNWSKTGWFIFSGKSLCILRWRSFIHQQIRNTRAFVVGSTQAFLMAPAWVVWKQGQISQL